MASSECPHCDQMKKENNGLRKALIDTNKNYVEVVNENLELRRRFEKFEALADKLFPRIEKRNDRIPCPCSHYHYS